jgi:SulP family sulfate permease
MYNGGSLIKKFILLVEGGLKLELFNSLKGYKAKFLLNDLMAGLLVAIIALPMSIALGIQSVPQEVSSNGLQLGIITAIVGGFTISFLGGSRFQIGGPTAAFFVIVYSYIANPDIGLVGLQFATFLAGIWLILFSIVKAGNMLKYMPYPITIGFTTGVGITLLVGQFKDFLGLNASGTNAVEKIVSCVKNINSFSLATFLIALLALAIIIIMQKINRKIPGAFFALIICTGLTVILTKTVGDLGIETIGSRYGNIKAEFNFLKFSAISDVKIEKIIIPSFVLAVLCKMESLLSAKVADGMANTNHNPNQELFGQGVANILSSLFGGLPAIGAIARTSANIKSGAKSSLAGIFHAIIVFIMYFSLMGVIKYIPLAVFAAILIVVSINMANFPLFYKLLKFGHRDFIVIVVCCLLTVFFNLIYGILGGIILTLLLNIPNMLKKLSVEKIASEKKTVYKIHGAIYFISVNKLIKIMTKELPLIDEVVLDFSDIKNIDESSVERLSDFYRTVKEKDKKLIMLNCNDNLYKRISNYSNIPDNKLN